MKDEKVLLEIKTELTLAAESLHLFADSLGKIGTALEHLINSDGSAESMAKRDPVRKKVVIKDGKVEQIKRVPAIEVVFNLIQNSKKGMDTPLLIKATGFKKHKIYNIVSRLKKQGRIQSGEWGVYKVV